MDVLHIRQHIFETTFPGLLQQQLAVTDDMVERCAQRMTQLRIGTRQVGGCARRLVLLTAGLRGHIRAFAVRPFLAHALAFPPSSASIFSSKRGSSMGLIS